MSRFVTDIFSKLTAQQKAFTDLSTGADKINTTELRKFIQPIVKTTAIYLVDRDYVLLDKAVVKKVLKNDGTDRYNYTKEGGDCDNFAITLLGRVKEMEILCDMKQGTAFGLVLGSIWVPGKEEPVNHAMNCFVYKDKNDAMRFKLIEPQNDKLIEHDERNKYWLILM